MFSWLSAVYHKRFSRKPWINVVSEGMDSSGQAKVEFDWNDAFIMHLKANGFNAAASEEEIVREWFQALHNEQIATLIAEVQEERDRLQMTGSNVISAQHPDLADPSKVVMK